MALARKPKMKEASAAAAEQEIKTIIEKGGSVAASESNGKKQDGKQKQPVVVHIPAEWLEQIDQIRAGRRIKTPRHTWLLEAIAEKIDREQASN